LTNKENESIYLKVQEWITTYKETTDEKQKEKLRNLIVVTMMPIVRKIARSIARRADDPIEDLVQAGALGLVKSIEMFNPKIGKKFKIYSGYIIVGEMQHYIRDKVALIRVPREIQEIALRIRNFVKDMSDENLEELTNEDVAKALDIPVRKINIAADMDRRKTPISLDQTISDDDSIVSIGDITPAYDYKEYIENYDQKLLLEDVVRKLPQDLAEIIKLFYYEGFNQKQISDKLGINPMMISRKIRKAHSLMYELITKSDYKE